VIPSGLIERTSEPVAAGADQTATIPTWYVVVAAMLLAAAAAAAATAGAAAPPPAASADRSRELLDQRCESELGLRRVTLFANGTVRLWDGLHESQLMTLGELGPSELEGYVNRLAEVDLSEVDETREGPDGSWVERCVLVLSLPDSRPHRFAFSRYDSLPLALGTLVRIADELSTRTLPLDGLPVGYMPKPGDVLRRVDGELFTIVAFTTDGQGVELIGRNQPLTLYLRREDLRGMFDTLVKRRTP
jgi:hypothetical protein